MGILLRWDKKQEMHVSHHHTAFPQSTQTDPARELGGPRTLRPVGCSTAAERSRPPLRSRPPAVANPLGANPLGHLPRWLARPFRFLVLVAGGLVAVVLAGDGDVKAGDEQAQLAVAAEAADAQRAEIAALQRFQRRERHMGTEFSMTVYASNADQATRAFDAAFARIAELDRVFSNYRSDSELARLGAASPHPDPVAVSDAMWVVLKAANEVSEASHGAFDMTIGPLTKLWRRARLEKQFPSSDRIEAAREAVGFQKIMFCADEHAIRLASPNMLLDPGGIVKGYALDEALAAAQSAGINRVLIDGGGDLIAGDAPPRQSAWRIGIAGFEPHEPVRQWIALENQAIATSGDLWQFVELQGKRYSHLIDPRRGIPLTRRSSVTVLAPTGILADAWASAFSVLGPDASLQQVAAMPGLELRFAFLDHDDGPARPSARAASVNDSPDSPTPIAPAPDTPATDRAEANAVVSGSQASSVVMQPDRGSRTTAAQVIETPGFRKLRWQ